LITAVEDGLPAADVGPWAVEKYRRMGMYADIFATGMKNQFPTRIYIDLFTGPGHANIRGEGKRVLTSPLLALSVSDRFSKYVYCDDKPVFVDALRQRAEGLAPETPKVFITGNANDRIREIAAAIPAHSKTSKVLSFCFVDPFGLDVRFDTIRALGEGRAMDFLILLALGMDANRNWALYSKPESQKVDDFLGDHAWRERWKSAEGRGTTPIRFLAEEYAEAMTRLGYLTRGIDQMIEVKTYENNMRLYYLAFFSKHERGYEFWREVQRYSTDQLGLL
jgi:three-Cys-motif partner protein